MNQILVDIREDVQATTEIKKIGATYQLVVDAPESFGVVKVNLNFNQLDDAIDKMRRYNAEPTFEELEDKVEALEKELEKYKSKN